MLVAVGLFAGQRVNLQEKYDYPEAQSQALWQRSRPVAPTLTQAVPALWHEVLQALDFWDAP